MKLPNKFKMASKELDDENFEKAFAIFKELAEEGFADAQIELAHMLYRGEGTKQDIEKALYWFNKNITHNPEAVRMSAFCYLKLNQPQKAIKAFMEACKKKNIYACNNLAYLYDTGEYSIKISKRKALLLYTKGCKQGNSESCHSLAILLDSLGCDKIDFIEKYIGILKFFRILIKGAVVNFLFKLIYKET